MLAASRTIEPTEQQQAGFREPGEVLAGQLVSAGPKRFSRAASGKK